MKHTFISHTSKLSGEKNAKRMVRVGSRLVLKLLSHTLDRIVFKIVNKAKTTSDTPK